jgi:hypothetical protein
MKTVAMPPETDLMDVAMGCFSGLSTPILVAARDEEQLEDFRWEHGLVCSEVRRLGAPGVRMSDFPDDKILVLLPGCREHAHTAALIDFWCLELDRYTSEVEPVKIVKPSALLVVILVSVLIWWVVVEYLF